MTDQEERPDRTFRRPAVRIDTLRNRLAATRELLGLVEDELEDLHVLAYERQVAAGEKVRGGQPDYALDTHGDRRARDAYRELGDVTIDVVNRLAVGSHDAIKLLRDGGDRGPNTARRLSLTELGFAIAKQAHRASTDSYEPRRHVAQPEAADVLATVSRSNERLQRENDRMRQKIRTLERAVSDANDRARRRSA